MGAPIIPTRDEAANGWTSESLTRYVEGRLNKQAENAGVVLDVDLNYMGQPKHNPTHADNAYDPFKW